MFNSEVDDLMPALLQMTISSKKHFLRKLKKIVRAIERYCANMPVLSYNGSGYDINLVKQQLFRQLGLTEGKRDDVFVIKQHSRYPVLSIKKFRYLDIMNYVGPGVSLDMFLKSYNTDKAKGYFPYEWLDHIDKLNSPVLPSYDDFYSSLKGCNVLNEEYDTFINNGGTGTAPLTGRAIYESLCNLWEDNAMTSFRDYLVYYNSLDVEPMIQAVDQMLSIYLQQGIDLFKESSSVSGVARISLFNSPNINEKFGLFNKYESNVHDMFKDNIVGGPSIVFTRYHEKNKTFIRQNKDKLCQSIVGYDANSLYLYCLSQKMPIGLPIIRNLEDNFIPSRRHHSAEATEWLEHYMHVNSVMLNTNTRGGERRVGPFMVDGFSKEKKLVCEYLGCIWHGCECVKNGDEKLQKQRYAATMNRIESLRHMGYQVDYIWGCAWRQEKKKKEVQKFIYETFGKKPYQMTEAEIIKAIKTDKLFGAIKCDIECPDENRDFYSEMAPIFKTIEVDIDVIGEHMQNFEAQGVAKRKTLVGGLKARNNLLATPLLKFYLSIGMVISNITTVIEYDSSECFKTFTEKVTETRRKADKQPSTKIQANTAKLLGNSAYGSLLMRVDRHKSVKYSESEAEVSALFNNKHFSKFTAIDERLYEIEMRKSRIKFGLPIQVGFMVLQYAKLHMLEFYYNFLCKYMSRKDFELCQMDTDSCYFALSKSSLIDCIKPSMKEVFDQLINRNCDSMISYAPTLQNPDFHLVRSCCNEHTTYR